MTDFLYFEPNGKNNMTENIIYNTDIIESFDGSEQRIPLLQEPRNLFSFYYTLMDNELKVFNNFIERNLAKEIDFPLWQEITFLTSNELIGSTVINYTSEFERFQDGMKFAIMKKNNVKINKIYTALLVNSVAGTITLGSGITEDWEEGDILLPVFTGLIVGNVQKVFPRGSDSIAGFDLKIQKSISDEKIVIDSIVEYPLYKNIYILDKQPNKTDNFAQELQKKILKLDLGYGKNVIYDKSNQNFNLYKYKWTLTDKEKINNFKTFCNTIKGRGSDFWMPTFENDMFTIDTVYNPTNDFIQIEDQDFYETYYTRVVNIKVNLKNGNYKLFEVLDMEKIGNTEKLTLDSTWGETINSEDIDSVNLIWKARFNNDEFLLIYINKNMAQIQKSAFQQKY
jgi:hypothetical protein